MNPQFFLYLAQAYVETIDHTFFSNQTYQISGYVCEPVSILTMSTPNNEPQKSLHVNISVMR